MATQSIFPAFVPIKPAASPNLSTPGDAQSLQDQYDLQRNQAIAQLLTQQGLEGTPQGQIVGGHYIRPNGFQGMANALKLYLGTKAMDDLPKQQAQMQVGQDQRLATQFGVGQQQPAQQPAGPQGFPVGASGAPPQGQPMGGQPDPQALGAALRGTQSQPGMPTMPILPGKTPMESYQIARSIGTQEYMKLAAQQNNLTDLQKNLVSMGIQPGSPQWNQAVGGSVTKAGYIAPTVVAPGGSIVQPGATAPSFVAPKDGIQLTPGPNGLSASEVPNYGAVNAGIAGQETLANERAKASQDVQPTYNPKTGNTENLTREQIVQAAQGGNPTVKTLNPQIQNASQNQTLIDSARSLLPQASSGMLSSALNQGAGTVGVSTKASQADAQLKVISAKLVQSVPRFEGPQSDKDVQQYREAAGNVADSSVPYQTRLAALKTMEDLQNRYLQSKGQAPSGMASPKSAQEFQSLPSGTLFMAPDGKIRRKP